MNKVETRELIEFYNTLSRYEEEVRETGRRALAQHTLLEAYPNQYLVPREIREATASVLTQCRETLVALKQLRDGMPRHFIMMKGGVS